jgi:group I intron endonuclease
MPEAFIIENFRALKRVRGIYAIAGPDSRVYVGQSSNAARRLRQHLSGLKKNGHFNSFLQRSWLKHGSDAFFFEILEEAVSGRSLKEIEQEWIDHHRLLGGVFNIRSPIEAVYGRSTSEETRAKISLARKGKALSDEHRLNISKGATEALADPLVRARISEASRRFWSDPAARTKYDRSWPLERRAEFSRFRLEVCADPVERKKMSHLAEVSRANPAIMARAAEARQRGLERPEVRAIISSKAKQRWTDPVYRRAATASIKQAAQDPATRAHHAAKMREAWADPERRANMLRNRKGGKPRDV